MKIYIGIDPGKTGGMCLIEDHYVKPIKFNDYIHETLQQLTRHTLFAIIENVHSFPKQGVVSSFTFGYNYGEWIGMLKALNIPFVRVAPSKWMRYFGTFSKEKSKRKHEIHKLAKERYPHTDITLQLADAVMIATYAIEMYNNS